LPSCQSSKLVFGFVQSITYMQHIYGLRLPKWYSDSVSFLDVVQSAIALRTRTVHGQPDPICSPLSECQPICCAVDLSGYAFPNQCLDGGVRSRILLRGIGPLIPIAVVSITGWIIAQLRGRGKRKLEPGTLRLLTFIAFVLVGPTSSTIFSTWTCEVFDLNSIADPPTTTALLLDDLSLRCDSSDKEYARVESLAFIFVGLWPIGTPLLFLALLLWCRVPILQGRMSRFVRASSFLHKEYTPCEIELRPRGLHFAPHPAC
jgi:hypothetical protein